MFKQKFEIDHDLKTVGTWSWKLEPDFLFCLTVCSCLCYAIGSVFHDGRRANCTTETAEPFSISLICHNLLSFLEPDRLRLLKNRDSDYLAILAIFQDYQLPILPKSSLFFRLLLDYQLPISRKVIGNLDYQLLILSNRSGSSLEPKPSKQNTCLAQ